MKSSGMELGYLCLERLKIIILVLSLFVVTEPEPRGVLIDGGYVGCLHSSHVQSALIELWFVCGGVNVQNSDLY